MLLEKNNIIIDVKDLKKSFGDLQIIKGISTNIKIRQLEALVRGGNLIDEDIPEKPTIDLNEFSDDYRIFVEKYLLKNIKNIFAENVVLKLGTKELYIHA